MQVCFIIFDLSFQMVVISSRSATVDICPCKMFRTRVEPHEPDLLLFALSVRLGTALDLQRLQWC